MASVTAPALASPRRVRPDLGRVRRPLALAGDVRIDLFGALFGLATIHHELQLLVELQLGGRLTEYMERWARSVPTIGWSSQVGIAVHVAAIVLGILLLALPWRRALLMPLAVVFGLVNLVSPHRIPSHNSLMLAALAVLLVFGVAELIARAWSARRAADFRAAEPGTDWYGWTLRGLMLLCVLTYVAAAFQKLNPSFLSLATSPAPLFLLQFARPFGVPRDAALALIGYPSIHATIAIELVLPLMLLVRRTRLFGCLLGILFHLPMMAYGIMDFPVLIVGFYPLFMRLEEAESLVARLTSRPSALRVLSAVVVGMNCAAAISASPYVLDLWIVSRGVEPLLMYAHGACLYATVFLFAYVASTLAAHLLDRRAPRAAVPATGVA